MFQKKWIVFAILIFIVVFPCSSYAVNLRGRIDGRNQFTGAPYAIGGATVDLYIQGPRGWQQVGRYTTGSGGMYYFQNILPGNYVLQINGKQNYPITVSNQPNQDLPLIVIQY